MVKRIYILLFGLVTSSVNAQNEIPFESFTLRNSIIEENRTLSDTIYGVPCSGQELIVWVSTKVQMSCNYGNPSANQYDVVKNQFSIKIIPDSLGSLRDSICSEIATYVDQKEGWAKQYNVQNFDNLPFYKSFSFSDSLIIPTIWSGSERNGDFYVFYIDNKLIKIELIEHQGLGALSSFYRQNFVFTKENREILMTKYVRSIEEARSILEAYQNE